MKRKNNLIYDNNNNNDESKIIKKYKKVFNWNDLDYNESDNKWISATKTKNYLLKDPVIDWLEEYYFKLNGFGDENNISDNRELMHEKFIINKELNLLKSTIMNKGLLFEEAIYKELENKFGLSNVIKVIDNYTELSSEKYNKTINYMKLGIPLILQAPLYNYNNKTFGIADIIIRSDYINKLIDNSIDYDESKRGCIFNENYHYRVIDIKWSQLNLCCDGKRLLNSDRIPCYKSQIAIYNLIVGKIQSYIPETAYILGKSYKYESKSEEYCGYNPFLKLGHINYDNFDNKYIDLTKKALIWFRDMKTNGYNWNLLTSTRDELCPNMCNKHDEPFTNIKTKLSNLKNEITNLWRISTTHRNEAFKNNIYKWSDKKLNSNILGIKQKSRLYNTINNMLEVNRNKRKKIIPTKVKNTKIKMNDKRYINLFIDFETLSDVFCTNNEKNDGEDGKFNIYNTKTNSYIFMIGMGYIENNNWKYINYTLSDLDMNLEKDMILKFINDIYNLKKTYNNNIRIFHWSHAEKSFLENFNIKNNNIISDFLNNQDIQFVDLYNIFINEPITIRGALSYKLKDVSNALYNLGLIKTTWNKSNSINNGLTAMIEGAEYYKNKNTNIINNIIQYNEIDCKVLSEIINLKIFK